MERQRRSFRRTGKSRKGGNDPGLGLGGLVAGAVQSRRPPAGEASSYLSRGEGSTFQAELASPLN